MEDIAKCTTCDTVQKISDCQQSYSVQLEVVTEDNITLHLSVFTDCLKEMLNKYNMINNCSITLKTECDDNELYRSLLYLPPMTIVYNKSTCNACNVTF